MQQELQVLLGRKWNLHRHPWAIPKIRMNEMLWRRLGRCTYLSRITLAIFKSARIIVTWHVPITTHDVINVLAQRWARRGIFTSSDTELGRGHEVLQGQVNNHQTKRIADTDRPLVQLLQLAVIEYAGEDQTTDGIAWN